MVDVAITIEKPVLNPQKTSDWRVHDIFTLLRKFSNDHGLICMHVIPGILNILDTH